MHKSRLLLAGATGAAGQETLRLLHARNHFIRTLSRSKENAAKIKSLASEVVLADATDAAAIGNALEGIEVMISCLGANVSLSSRERRSFHAVDLVANTNLLEAAKRAGVKRLVYLSAHEAPGYAHTRYMQAHLEMEQRIRASGLSFSFVRPTGIFTALADLLGMARSGMGSVTGNGQAKANPIHPTDVAETLVEVVNEGPEVISAGGPDILTREEIMRLAFEAVGKNPRIMHVPVGIFRATSAMIRPLHPRLGDLFEFVAAVTTTDSVAPTKGKRKLKPWFEELGRQSAS